MLSESPGIGRGPEDTHQAEAVERAIANGGAYIGGRGGSGKSYLLELLRARLIAEGLRVEWTVGPKTVTSTNLQDHIAHHHD